VPNKLNQTTPDTIRTFATPAVATGSLTQAELDAAIALLVEAANPTPLAPKQDRLITFTAAAEQIGVSTKTINRMLYGGELLGKRLRPKYPQSMRIFQSSIDALLTPDGQEVSFNV
jgi:hypothetical protein